MVIGYEPMEPAPGVPAKTPVVALRVTPLGNAPVSVYEIEEFPVAITGKVSAVSMGKVVLAALVKVVSVTTVMAPAALVLKVIA